MAQDFLCYAAQDHPPEACPTMRTSQRQHAFRPIAARRCVAPGPIGFSGTRVREGHTPVSWHSFSIGLVGAIIPGITAAVLMIIRTSFEDRMLQAELPGYREFAQEVRYRLVPRIW